MQPLNPASEALEIIAMLGANAFDHSFVKNLMAESDREAMVYPEPELPAMFTSQPSMYQMDLFGDNWMQSLSNLQQPMMNEYDSLPPLQTMNSTLSLYGTGTNSSSIDKKSKTSRKRPEIINSRRKTVQHEMSCNHCNGHLGLAFLRGAYSCDKELPVSISCQSCSEIHAKDDEHRRMGKLIECEICHCNIGSGFLDVCSEDELKSECVCGGCGDKYMFCSECGGGGKQRTGKWRPKELFEQGRRTCSLPHIRVGTAELHYSTIPVEQLTTEVLLGVQEVFFDCMFSLYCIPSIMANYKYDSFEMIKRDIEQLWLKSVLDVLTNKVLNGKKYVSVAWIHKRHRNKGVGRSSTTKDTVPWLQKLGISGIINPPADLTAGDSEERNHCFVAFSIAEWLPHTQSIFLAQMAPRSVFLKTMDGYIDLIKYSIDRIKEDAENIGYHVPRHIWCWAKGDHARLQSIPGRLRFVAKEDYLATQKGLDPDFFERPAYEPLNARGTLVFATSIKIFNSKSK